jgi:hypothetical protein
MMARPTQWQEQTQYSCISSLDKGIVGTTKSSVSRNSPQKVINSETDMNMSSIV